jgi:hypothetical protein
MKYDTYVSESLKAESVYLMKADSGGKPFPQFEKELQITCKVPVQSLQTELSIQIHSQSNVLSCHISKVLLYSKRITYGIPAQLSMTYIKLKVWPFQFKV